MLVHLYQIFDILIESQISKGFHYRCDCDFTPTPTLLHMHYIHEMKKINVIVNVMN